MRGLACAAAAASLLLLSGAGGSLAADTPNPAAAHAILGKVPVLGKASTASGLGNLSYHGGPTMTTNKTYAIYWIPAGYSVASGYTSTINQFFGDVAHDSGMSSNVYAVATQYSGIKYTSTFGGSFTDTSAFPASGCPIYE